MKRPTIVITGACGFIGSHFFREISPGQTNYNWVCLDALTYAGNLENIKDLLEKHSHLFFEHIDIRDRHRLGEILKKYYPISGIIHFAAETHVDQAINSPTPFIETNIVGTSNLLSLARELQAHNTQFRFLHISTDEVYGQLGSNDKKFSEKSPLAPTNPYSASKAAADLLVQSYFHTYQLNCIISRSSNNFGPFQFREKLIPMVIHRALNNLKIPIYGRGENIRDWIFVEDNIEGIWRCFQRGKLGEIYNLGGNCEMRNIELVKKLLKILNKPESLIEFVADRKSHDFRYALDCTKAFKQLNWQPSHLFDQALEKTVEWYQKMNHTINN